MNSDSFKEKWGKLKKLANKLYIISNLFQLFDNQSTGIGVDIVTNYVSVATNFKELKGKRVAFVSKSVASG